MNNVQRSLSFGNFPFVGIADLARSPWTAPDPKFATSPPPLRTSRPRGIYGYTTPRSPLRPIERGGVRSRPRRPSGSFRARGRRLPLGPGVPLPSPPPLANPLGEPLRPALFSLRTPSRSVSFETMSDHASSSSNGNPQAGQNRPLPKKESDSFRNVVKFYESKHYKKGLKNADAILRRFPNHGETLCMKGLIVNAMAGTERWKEDPNKAKKTGGGGAGGEEKDEEGDKKKEAVELVKRGLMMDMRGSDGPADNVRRLRKLTRGGGSKGGPVRGELGGKEGATCASEPGLGRRERPVLSCEGLTLDNRTPATVQFPWVVQKRAWPDDIGKASTKLTQWSHVCWHVYGLLHRSSHNYAEAVKAYKQALKIDPENLQILRDMGLLQIQVRDLRGFRDTRLRVLTLRPNSRAHWLTYAVACHANGDPKGTVGVLDGYLGTVGEDGAEFRRGFESSELAMYRNRVLAETKGGEDGLDGVRKALEHLDEVEEVIVDRTGWLAAKLSHQLKLGRFDDANKTAWLLFERGCTEDHRVHGAYMCALLECDRETCEEVEAMKGTGTLATLRPLDDREREVLLSAYEAGESTADATEVIDLTKGEEDGKDNDKDEDNASKRGGLARAFPKSVAVKRIRLTLLAPDGDEFKDAVDKYCRCQIVRGVPSLGADLSAFYLREAEAERDDDDDALRSRARSGRRPSPPGAPTPRRARRFLRRVPGDPRRVPRRRPRQNRGRSSVPSSRSPLGPPVGVVPPLDLARASRRARRGTRFNREVRRAHPHGRGLLRAPSAPLGRGGRCQESVRCRRRRTRFGSTRSIHQQPRDADAVEGREGGRRSEANRDVHATRVRSGTESVRHAVHVVRIGGGRLLEEEGRVGEEPEEVQYVSRRCVVSTIVCFLCVSGVMWRVRCFERFRSQHAFASGSFGGKLALGSRGGEGPWARLRAMPNDGRVGPNITHGARKWLCAFVIDEAFTLSDDRHSLRIVVPSHSVSLNFLIANGAREKWTRVEWTRTDTNTQCIDTVLYGRETKNGSKGLVRLALGTARDQAVVHVASSEFAQQEEDLRESSFLATR
ncbi:hypothetical protein ACHAWF_008138 [Thalassiosira exigua]